MDPEKPRVAVPRHRIAFMDLATYTSVRLALYRHNARRQRQATRNRRVDLDGRCEGALSVRCTPWLGLTAPR